MGRMKKVTKGDKVLVSLVGKVTKENCLEATIKNITKEIVVLESTTLRNNAPKTKGIIHIPTTQMLTRVMDLNFQAVKPFIPSGYKSPAPVVKHTVKKRRTSINRVRIVTQSKLDAQKARKKALIAARKDEDRRLAVEAEERRKEAVNGLNLKTKEGGKENG